MKVFHWHSVRALANHGDGYLIVIAKDKKEAVWAVQNNEKVGQLIGEDEYALEERELRRLIDELQVTEPRVYDLEPMAFAIHGSN